MHTAYVCHDLDWLRGVKNACTKTVLLPDMICLGMIEACIEARGKTTLTGHYHLSSVSIREHLESDESPVIRLGSSDWQESGDVDDGEPVPL